MDITIGHIKSPDSKPPWVHVTLGPIKSPDSEPPSVLDTLGPIKPPDSEYPLARTKQNLLTSEIRCLTEHIKNSEQDANKVLN